MTTPETPAVPAGWYPDPAGGPNSRWWDGVRWTETVQQPYDPAAPAASLTAPEGVSVWTPWIWLVVFVPYITLPLLFTIDFSSMLAGIDPNDPDSANRVQLEVMTSPGYVISAFGGWVTYGLAVLFSFFDYRALTRRAIPRPFHWAWSFLYSPVYAIGRSVIVRRRTGRGIAPMWVAIAMMVFSTIVYLVWLGTIFATVFEQASRYPGY